MCIIGTQIDVWWTGNAVFLYTENRKTMLDTPVGEAIGFFVYKECTTQPSVAYAQEVADGARLRSERMGRDG